MPDDKSTYFRPFSDLGEQHAALYARYRKQFAPPLEVEPKAIVPSYVAEVSTNTNSSWLVYLGRLPVKIIRSILHWMIYR